MGVLAEGVVRVNLEGVCAGGIVAEEEYDRVVAQTRRVLLGIRGVNGERIVERVVRSENFSREGLGGPHGGELHLALFPNLGYYWADALGPEGAPLVDDETGGFSGWHGNRVARLGSPTGSSSGGHAAST